MTISAIIHAVSPHRRFLVGLSGGLDSTVLLHRFKIWRDQEEDVHLRAVHIHHGLSPNADNLENQCMKLCQSWNINLTVFRITVIKKKIGIEAQARKMRYELFQKILLPDEVLVTAHHLDDQCETFLLALKRGSGPAGLSSMSKRLNISNNKLLLRPFLEETRESLKIWAKKYSLHWIEDETNQDEYYDRNFLRLHVIPILNKRWPHISTAISRSASLCAEQENLLDELLKDELKKIISEEGGLQIVPLIKLSAPHRSALLRRWFSTQGALMPTFLMLNRIWKEVAQARIDAIPCIHLYDGYDVRRFKGLLWRIKSQPSCRNMKFFWKDIDKPLILPNGLGQVSLRKGGHIVSPTLKEIVTIRFKVDGRIHIVGRFGSRKIKKIWQELNIPPWERNRIPLLFYNEKLIAAVGSFVTQEGWIKNGMYFERNS